MVFKIMAMGENAVTNDMFQENKRVKYFGIA